MDIPTRECERLGIDRGTNWEQNTPKQGRTWFLTSDIAAAFKATDLSKQGDVVVIDSHGSINTAFWGENMTMSAINRGAIGAVIDGACRDIEEIGKMKFPVICKGPMPYSTVSGLKNTRTARRSVIS